MIKYKVRQGDCLASIAEKHGFSWDFLWNLPENSNLRNKHQEPTILLPDEIVCIPEPRPKHEEVATEQRHRFKKKGTPAKLRLQIMRQATLEQEQSSEQPYEEMSDEEALEVVEEDTLLPEDEAEEPWANASYILDIDGKIYEGKTDTDRKLELSIPPEAKRGKLTICPGTDRAMVYIISLGHMDPVNSFSGVAKRLKNLGYFNGPPPKTMTHDLQEALKAFQKANGLQESGEIDQPTQDKLIQVHGS